jgi:hypothetical protein
VIGLLRALVYRVFGDAPDAKWKPTGLRFTTARDYDYELAKAGALRARRRTASGKTMHRPKPIPRAKVLPMGERTKRA